MSAEMSAEMWLLPSHQKQPRPGGRDEIIGEGKLLGTDLAFASEEVLQEKVQDLFERWERPGHSWTVFFWGEFADNLADISSWGMLGGEFADGSSLQLSVKFHDDCAKLVQICFTIIGVLGMLANGSTTCFSSCGWSKHIRKLHWHGSCFVRRYLQKMLSRVITPLDSFTRPAADFSCSWAQELVSHEVIQDLWGSGSRHFESLSDLSDLSGVAILDHTVTAELISRARLELAQLELAGEVTASKDPCASARFFLVVRWMFGG